MPRVPHHLTTTQRGLGWAHQKERALKLPRAYNTPCPMCRRPMLRGQALDLHHPHARVYGGKGGDGIITHATCNRRDGQAITTRRRRGRRTPTQAHPTTNSRRW